METDLSILNLLTNNSIMSFHLVILITLNARSIHYSLALRLRRIFSSHDSYIQLTNELINYLTNRGYDKGFLTTQIQRASDVPRADALKNKPPTQTETTTFCYYI